MVTLEDPATALGFYLGITVLGIGVFTFFALKNKVPIRKILIIYLIYIGQTFIGINNYLKGKAEISPLALLSFVLLTGLAFYVIRQKPKPSGANSGPK